MMKEDYLVKEELPSLEHDDGYPRYTYVYYPWPYGKHSHL